IDLFAFIHALDPTKVRVVEQEREEDEPRLLETTVGHTVPLLPVARDHAENELDASVGRLFDEGGNGHQTEQEDSIGGGKRKSVVMDAGGVSHPPKKLREDYGTPNGASLCASVSTTPEREDEDHTDSVVESNLCTIWAPSSTNIMKIATTVTFTVDSTLVAKEKLVKPSLFAADSSSAGGGIPTLVVTNGSRLDDDRVCREMVDEFAPPKFFTSVHGMKHGQLFIEFNVRAARQMSLSVERDDLLKVRDGEIENLKAQLLLKEAETAEAIRLRAQTSNLEAVENSLHDE
nr:hypothetical protein [Tanacetum cinerariifolium]